MHNLCLINEGPRSFQRATRQHRETVLLHSLFRTFHSTKIPVFIYENWHALANKTASSGISIKEDELQSKVKTICRTIFFLYMHNLKQCTVPDVCNCPSHLIQQRQAPSVFLRKPPQAQGKGKAVLPT